VRRGENRRSFAIFVGLPDRYRHGSDKSIARVSGAAIANLEKLVAAPVSTDLSNSTSCRRIDGGFFLTLEGPEGAGKTTQLAQLNSYFQQQGYQVVQTREPGGTPLGEQLRQVIKHYDGADGVSAEAELLLFAACRAQLMQQVILPALAAGAVVLSDRFIDSTTVYQGLARGLDMLFIAQLHAFCTHMRSPDLTLVLDLSEDEGLRRAAARSPGKYDRIEAEAPAFHRLVRQGFLQIAAAQPQRIRVVDASGNCATVHQRIMEIVRNATAGF